MGGFRQAAASAGAADAVASLGAGEGPGSGRPLHTTTAFEETGCQPSSAPAIAPDAITQRARRSQMAHGACSIRLGGGFMVRTSWGKSVRSETCTIDSSKSCPCMTVSSFLLPPAKVVEKRLRVKCVLSLLFKSRIRETSDTKLKRFLPIIGPTLATF